MFSKNCYSYCCQVVHNIYHTALQCLTGKKYTTTIQDNLFHIPLLFHNVFLFLNTPGRNNTNARRNLTRISKFSTAVNIFSTKVRRNITRVGKNITGVRRILTAVFKKFTNVRKSFARAVYFSANCISFNNNSQHVIQNIQNVSPEVCFVFTGNKYNILNSSNILFSAFHS